MYGIKKIAKEVLPFPVREYFLESLEAYRELRSKRSHKSLLLNSEKQAQSLLDSQNPVTKLEIGAGNRKGENGWITLDLNTECDLYWDLNLPLPFPANSIDMIYASHVLEHFFYSDLMSLLANCHKVLKKGGKISVCVPDASIYIKGYLSPDEFCCADYCKYKPAFNYGSPIDYVNYIAYMDGHHRYMFDPEGLVSILQKAGFTDVKLRQFDPCLDMVERDYESVYAEAEK